jgi:hypothetical protein
LDLRERARRIGEDGQAHPACTQALTGVADIGMRGQAAQLADQLGAIGAAETHVLLGGDDLERGLRQVREVGIPVGDDADAGGLDHLSPPATACGGSINEGVPELPVQSAEIEQCLLQIKDTNASHHTLLSREPGR